MIDYEVLRESLSKSTGIKGSLKDILTDLYCDQICGLVEISELSKGGASISSIRRVLIGMGIKLRPKGGHHGTQ